MFQYQKRALLPLTKEQEQYLNNISQASKYDLTLLQHFFNVFEQDKDAFESFITTTVKPYGYKYIPNIVEGVELLHEHIEKRSYIRIVGDYDVDGITSIALIYKALKFLGAEVDYIIPNRHIDGYGIQISHVEGAIESGVDLLITVDNGISAIEPVRIARENSIDVLITDHHATPTELPCANVIVNPMLSEDKKCHVLAGVGVAYKLIQAYMSIYKIKPPKDLVDMFYVYCALGTICDSRDLLYENRTLIRLGFKAYNEGNVCTSLKKLANTLTLETVNYKIGPCLNACGRLSTGYNALECLMYDDKETLINELIELNNTRKEMQREASNNVKGLIKIQTEIPPIIIEIANIESGLIGLVAGDMVKEFKRPAIIFSPQNGEFKASGRSIPSVNLLEIISPYIYLLKGGGGHAGACGLTASNMQQITDFKCAVLNHCKQLNLKTVDNNEEVFYDIELDSNTLDLHSLFIQFNVLYPIDKNILSPSFLIRNANVTISTSPRGKYILTEFHITDSKDRVLSINMWGDTSYPTTYTGTCDLILKFSSDNFSVVAINYHKPYTPYNQEYRELKAQSPTSITSASSVKGW